MVPKSSQLKEDNFIINDWEKLNWAFLEKKLRKMSHIFLNESKTNIYFRGIFFWKIIWKHLQDTTFLNHLKKGSFHFPVTHTIFALYFPFLPIDTRCRKRWLLSASKMTEWRRYFEIKISEQFHGIETFALHPTLYKGNKRILCITLKLPSQNRISW